MEILISKNSSSSSDGNVINSKSTDNLPTPLTLKIADKNLQFGRKEANISKQKLIKSMISQGQRDIIQEEVKEDDEGDIVLNFGNLNNDPIDDWHEVTSKRGTTSKRNHEESFGS